MGCQAGCTRVQGQILNHWPTETYNAGCYNPNSFLDNGITPSSHQLGEAIDIGIEVPYRGRSSVGQEIFAWLHANRVRLGIVQLIYSEQVWSATNQPGSIRSYTVNPHYDHIHCQLNPTAARNASLTAEPFGDDMPLNADDLKAIDAHVAAIGNTIIGAIQSSLKTYVVPEIVKAIKAIPAGAAADAKAIADELAKRLVS